MSQLIVHLRVFRGKTLNNLDYNKDGYIKTEIHVTKVEYGSQMWSLYTSKLKTEYTAAIVEDVIEVKVNEAGVKVYEPVSDFSNIKNEVASFFESEEKAMTPEQKRIAELEAEMKELRQSLKSTYVEPKAAKQESATGFISELEERRKEYEELFGEKPHHKMSIDTLVEKIDAKKNS